MEVFIVNNRASKIKFLAKQLKKKATDCNNNFMCTSAVFCKLASKCCCKNRVLPSDQGITVCT